MDDLTVDTVDAAQVDAPDEALGFGPSEPWLAEIRAASKREKNWRKDARATLKRYALEHDSDSDRDGKFNILWSNTEVLRQAIYNQAPRPDVRQRWETKDPVAVAVAELLDRGLTYTIDTSGFEVVGRRAVLDFLLPGRPVVRVRYVPTLEPVPGPDGQPMRDEAGKPVERVADECVVFENVPWNDFLHANATCWENVDWIAFRHRVLREDADRLFPAFADKLTYTDPEDDGQDEDGRPVAQRSDASTERDRRAKVWEVWDARTRKVIWVADGIDEVLLREKPPLDLKGFYPIPRPALSIERPGDLTPQPLYIQYQEQAKELDLLTRRITKTVGVIKWRGLYDATLGDDLGRLFSEAKDGDLVPTDKGLSYVEKGGLAAAIYTMPLNEVIAVLQNLYQSREAVKQTIYEITGISDVIRGSSDPNETATAQKIKASFGSSRLDGMKREIQRLFRDALQIAAEVMAEHFSRETWGAMTSSKYPTAQDKQAAQQALSGMQDMARQQAMLAQQQGQQPKPDQAMQQRARQMQAVLQQPSWEDIERVMRSDLLRSYRVDIETDSTIVPDQQAESKALADTMQMLGGLIQQIVPGVEKGIIPRELGMRLISATVRKTPLTSELSPIFDDYEAQMAGGDPLEKQISMLKRENNDLKGQLQQKGAETRLKAMEIQGDQRIAEGDLALRAEELRQRQAEALLHPLAMPGQGGAIHA